jgi:hypothetical protein
LNPGLWLSHHGPEHGDRCVHVAGVAICRRCLALWPLTYLLIGAQVALRTPAHHDLDVLLPLALLPPVLDYVEVHTGLARYDPARTWALTPLLAVGLARLLFRHMAHPFDPVNWAVLLLAALPAAWAAWRFATHRPVYHSKSSQEPES